MWGNITTYLPKKWFKQLKLNASKGNHLLLVNGSLCIMVTHDGWGILYIPYTMYVYYKKEKKTIDNDINHKTILLWWWIGMHNTCMIIMYAPRFRVKIK